MNSLDVAPPSAETDQLVELFAVMNMATQAADERIATESNKTTAKFCEMMEAMQASMKLNAEEMHSLRERLEASEQRNKELDALRQAEKRAAEARVTTLEAKVDALSERLITEQTKMREFLTTHTHNYGTHSHHPDSTSGWSNIGGGYGNGGLVSYKAITNTTDAPNPPPPPKHGNCVPQ